MTERLRFLLDRPLDPRAARAALVLSGAILVGLGALFILGTSEPGSPAPAERPAVELGKSTKTFNAEAKPRPGGSFGAVSPAMHDHRRRQDPQDQKGSPAATRAAKSLRSHRALQHVPYRRGVLTVRLVGARGGRAVLAVSAPTIAAAREGWRRFLGAYRDQGRSYTPVFRVSLGQGGDR